MTQWLLAGAIVVAVLACPAMMWLGRRGIGPGCAVCPPHRRDESDEIEELRARQHALSAQIEELERRRASDPVAGRQS